MKREEIPSPSFVLEEEKFRKNLALIRSVKERAGVTNHSGNQSCRRTYQAFI